MPRQLSEAEQVMVMAENMADLFEGENILIVARALTAHMIELAAQMQTMQGRDQDMDEAIDIFSKTLAEASLVISSDDIDASIATH